MLQNFTISFYAIFPLFLLILLGNILKKMQIIERNIVPELNKLLFNVLFPCLIFCSTYGADFESQKNIKLAIYIAGIAIFFWFATIPFAKKISKNNRTQGAIVTCINRTNFVVISLPVLVNLFGEKINSYIAFPIFALLLVNNIVSVIILELFRQNEISFMKIGRDIIKNPLIIATVSGAFFMIFGLAIPQVLYTTINSIGNTAVPLALLLLGASIELSTFRTNRSLLFICLFGKLILIPAAGAIAGYIIGFRDVDIVVIVTFLAAPIATTSYTMAMQLNSDEDLTRDCVFLSTSLCIISFFIWIFLLKMLQLF